MMYKFYIADVLLPIAPQALSINVDDKDTEIELANGETMSVLNPPGLTTYKFTFRAPNVKYPFALYTNGYIEAPAFLSVLQYLKTSQKPFNFKVIRGNTYVEHRDINTTVSLVSYDIEEDAENGKDYMISVELKEYVRHKTYKDAKFDSNGNLIIETNDDREVDENKFPYPLNGAYYTIQPKDTFMVIARKFFGSMSYAEAIAKHNKMEFTTDELIEGEVIDLNEGSILKLAETIDAEHKANQEEIEAEIEEVTSSE